MIKANELRPGNLIDYCDPITNEIKTVVIDALKKSIGSFQIKHDSYIELWLPLLNCEGIPLTPEWLERCGFKKDEAVEYGHYRQNGFYLFEDDELPGLFHDILSQFKGTRTELQYLHQLQNLYYALTGEELNIKEITA